MESLINPDAPADQSNARRLPKLVRSQLQRRASSSRQTRGMHGIEQRVREVLDRRRSQRLFSRPPGPDAARGGR